MEEDIDEYVVRIKGLKTRNDAYIEEFEKSMRMAGLSDATVRRHVDNVEFFLNFYAADRYEVDAEGAADYIGAFLGDYFIYKCMWSSVKTLKQNITSIKKFYQFMASEDLVPQETYKRLCDTIKDEKDEWIGRMEEYDRQVFGPDPSKENLSEAELEIVAKAFLQLCERMGIPFPPGK